MADTTEEALEPQDLCIKAVDNGQPLCEDGSLNLTVRGQNNNEPCAKIEPKEEALSEADKNGVSVEVQVKPEPDETEEVKIKQEFEEGHTEEIQRSYSALVGKVKIKPMATLVETSPPNPQPSLHPFFAGFDDHIRSLIINRQPQFPMPLLKQPGRFMYYDNSTNQNLKKMLNGHKMALPRQCRPYVPINVPRPPRSQPFRSSFSTQTPPMFMGTSAPSTSYQWPPLSQPAPNLSPQTGQNFSLKHHSMQTNEPPMTSTLPLAFTSPTLTTPNKSVTQSKKVSTSSSTDDLENHSGELATTFKTEIDLGVDSKEELRTGLGTHFMEMESPMPSVANPVEVKVERPVLTGDTVAPVMPKRHPDYELPPYSTKGPLLCKCCDFRCNRKTKMKEHFETMHSSSPNGKFKCFYCVKKMASPIYHLSVNELEHHVAKVHRGEKRYQCKDCFKSYKAKSSWKYHREKFCTQLYPYACHMCTFLCKTESCLEKHIKSHEKLHETEQCPFCEKTFKKLYIKTHLIQVHAPPDERPFRCEMCDFTSATQSTLDTHLKRSGHNKKFKCNHCSAAYSGLGSLKTHIKKLHSNPSAKTNKLLCGVDGCKVRTFNEQSLINHRKLHSIPDSELFICPDEDCRKKFTAKRLLCRHIQQTRHHKPFKCTDCSLRFLREESLHHHIQSVHVARLVAKMEANPPGAPVVVKNVVDVYKSGGIETAANFDNFGCWLGISGFGDVKTDCDNQEPQAAMNEKIQVNEETAERQDEEPMEDEDYQSIVPITCLVEVKQEDELNVGTTDEDVKKEEDDSDYQCINPDITNLVECQQNPTEGDNEISEAECLPTNLVVLKEENVS